VLSKERVAAQAWQELTDAVESGGDTVRSWARRSTDLAEEATDRVSDKVGSALDESRRRAGAALDALSGRRTPMPWEWLLAAVAGGVVLGWVGSILTRRAAEQAALAADLGEVRDFPSDLPDN
jgi:hypothetical protein